MPNQTSQDGLFANAERDRRERLEKSLARLEGDLATRQAAAALAGSGILVSLTTRVLTSLSSRKGRRVYFLSLPSIQMDSRVCG
jgi:hypothetical protein